MFRIHVYLPKIRAAQGWLHLFGDDGAELLANVPCRGKADTARAAREGNPEREPTRPYGDTPSGAFAPARFIAYAPPHPRLGALFLPLDGVDGDALTAKMCGRTGLGVHGGRGDDNLVATFGCLRLRDADISKIYGMVGDAPVAVTIEDVT